MQAISKLVLGTVQFGLDYGINNSSGKPDQKTINEILYNAYISGIRYLDTAEAYGSAHSAIGQFHQKIPEHRFDIVTKLPHVIDENVDLKIESYLRDLQVAKLHGLLFHSYQTYKDNKAAMATLIDYKAKGKVTYLGVSIYTNEQILDVIEDPAIDIIQLPFNLFDNINLRGNLLKKIKDKGKQVHTRSAFLQGLFFMPQSNSSKIANSLNKELEFIRDLSVNKSIGIQKLALNYCLQQQNIDHVLIGVDNLTQLKQNLEDAHSDLEADVINEINKIKIKNIDLLNPSLWNQ